MAKVYQEIFHSSQKVFKKIETGICIICNAISKVIMKQKVVIIGYGFDTRLFLAQTLGALGFEVSIIALNISKSKPIDYYSKYVKHYYYTQGDYEDKILHILLNECKDENQKVVIIPINDFSASVLDKNLELLKPHFLFQHIHHSQGAVVEWMNKEKQKKLAQSVGMNVAASINIVIVNRTYEIPADVHYPCFTKTRSFTSGYKHTLHRCENEHELREVLDYLCQMYENLTLMVEDYKEIEKEYAVVGVSDGKNVVIPAVMEILSMAKGSDRGIALQGKVMPCNGYEDLIKLFELFIREIGFVGMFDIDFYRCEGLYYFGELNLRIGGSGFAVISQGVNLPEMHIKSLLGKNIDGLRKEITSSVTYLNERICTENWFEGHLTNHEFFSIFKSSDVSAIKCKHDRKPEFIFWLKTIKKYFILFFETFES